LPLSPVRWRSSRPRRAVLGPISWRGRKASKHRHRPGRLTSRSKLVRRVSWKREAAAVVCLIRLSRPGRGARARSVAASSFQLCCLATLFLLATACAARLQAAAAKTTAADTQTPNTYAHMLFSISVALAQTSDFRPIVAAAALLAACGHQKATISDWKPPARYEIRTPVCAVGRPQQQWQLRQRHQQRHLARRDVPGNPSRSPAEPISLSKHNANACRRPRLSHNAPGKRVRARLPGFWGGQSRSMRKRRASRRRCVTVVVAGAQRARSGELFRLARERRRELCARLIGVASSATSGGGGHDHDGQLSRPP
jgi:hypothetical protein